MTALLTSSLWPALPWRILVPSPQGAIESSQNPCGGRIFATCSCKAFWRFWQPPRWRNLASERLLPRRQTATAAATAMARKVALSQCKLLLLRPSLALPMVFQSPRRIVSRQAPQPAKTLQNAVVLRIQDWLLETLQ